MKMLIISMLCLLIIIFVWFFYYYFSIETAYEYFINKLDNISNYVMADNWNDAISSNQYILAKWQKIEKLWVYFMHQEDIDNIRASILKIDKCLKATDKAMTLSEIEELKINFDRIKGNESLTLENIF